MYCENCGKELREDAKFCTSCGAKIGEVVETTEVEIKEEPVEEEIIEPKVTKEEITETIKEAKTISRNNKKSKLPLILIILVILGIGGYYAYKTFFANKAAIIKGLINGMYDKFEETMNAAEDFDINKDSILINGDFSIDSNIDELKDLKDFKITYTTGIDYKNKKMEIGAGLVEDDEKLIDALMYILNNKVYFDLKDYYDSLIKIDNDELDFDQVFSMNETNINNEDIKYLVKTYKDILIESLDMDDFEESNDEIEIDGKDVKVKTLEYELTYKGIEKLSKEMTKKMLKDKKLISKLAKISGADEDDIKTSYPG